LVYEDIQFEEKFIKYSRNRLNYFNLDFDQSIDIIIRYLYNQRIQIEETNEMVDESCYLKVSNMINRKKVYKGTRNKQFLKEINDIYYQKMNNQIDNIFVDTESILSKIYTFYGSE